jgi:hypothetical protein
VIRGTYKARGREMNSLFGDRALDTKFIEKLSGLSQRRPMGPSYLGVGGSSSGLRSPGTPWG